MHRFVKAWRDERARVPVHAYVPMSFAPGEAYQFDWSHETITLAGLPLTVKAAHMKLSHSRMPFVRAYFRETQELVFDAHDKANRPSPPGPADQSSIWSALRVGVRHSPTTVRTVLRRATLDAIALANNAADGPRRTIPIPRRPGCFVRSSVTIPRDRSHGLTISRPGSVWQVDFGVAHEN